MGRKFDRDHCKCILMLAQCTSQTVQNVQTRCLIALRGLNAIHAVIQQQRRIIRNILHFIQQIDQVLFGQRDLTPVKVSMEFIMHHLLKNSRIVDKSCQLMFLLRVPREGSGSPNVSSVVGYKLRMAYLTSATLCA